MATNEGIQVVVAAFALWCINNPLIVSFCFSVIALIFTYQAITFVKDVFLKKGLSGKDMLKPHSPELPESMGVIVGMVYFVTMFLFIPVQFIGWFRGGREGDYESGELQTFPHERLAQYLGSLLSLFSMFFLGFADDVLDIRWRVKIWFPFAASIPLLMVYFVTFNKTHVILPPMLKWVFGTQYVDLGLLYYLYMSLLCVFSTNAINIIAGVNGIEGTQSLVIALSIALNDLLQLSSTNPVTREAHSNSLYFLLPFIGVTLGYLLHNWYPARVFGGDTFTYFAGMVFPVVGIMGHFSKTVLLFMIPQMFNFVYSCPQVFHFVECPRHRMPRLNPKTQLIEASRSPFIATPSDNSKPNKGGIKRKMGKIFLLFLEFFGLCDIRHFPRLKLNQMPPKPKRTTTKSAVRTRQYRAASSEEEAHKVNGHASSSSTAKAGKPLNSRKTNNSRNNRGKHTSPTKSNEIEISHTPSIRKIKSPPVRTANKFDDDVPGVVLRFDWVNGNLEGNCVRVVPPNKGKLSDDADIWNLTYTSIKPPTSASVSMKRSKNDAHRNGSSELVTLAGLMASKVAKQTMEVETNNEPIHGRISDIYHDDICTEDDRGSLFDKIPSPFKAVRYHSLIVSNKDVPSCMKVTAWTYDKSNTDEKVIMAMVHTSKPIWTVQFHPESICTEFGRELIENFISIARNHRKNLPGTTRSVPREISNITTIPTPISHPSQQNKAQHHKIRIWKSNAFPCPASSFMLRYNCGSRTLQIFRDDSSSAAQSNIRMTQEIRLTAKDTCFSWISAKLQEYGMNLQQNAEAAKFVELIDEENSKVTLNRSNLASHIPFDFLCGMVGYFGYEMKAESMGVENRSFQHLSANETPDSAFLFSDRVVVFDHLEKKTYVVILEKIPSETTAETIQVESFNFQWAMTTKNSLEKLHAAEGQTNSSNGAVKREVNKVNLRTVIQTNLANISLREPKDMYVHNVLECLRNITDGETYELCLTTQITMPTKILETKAADRKALPYRFYQKLRSKNPAPYAAFLEFGDVNKILKGSNRDFSPLVISSSSPECFLKIGRNRLLMMKPIKGTVARENNPAEDNELKYTLEHNEKDRAENLMIVDLIRNDLNTITEPDTVNVPKLMNVETFATVHQLVSTICGTLREDLTHVDAVMRSFPPAVSIGGGGAVTALSDPVEEYEEMLLKCDSVFSSFDISSQF
ncbi:tunicamycin resistance protein [Nowakowskiella sp. JEL0407]|nr:tunicamycin resistance protein [Nowakowskiella sp. JEL0407]